jgi:hypothetical protein
MTRKQIKDFYKLLGKRAGVRFVELPKVVRFLRWALQRIPKKFSALVPEIADRLRPCYTRIGKVEIVLLKHEIGDVAVPLIYQLEVAGHEVGHKFQIKDFLKDGGTVSRWYNEYYTDPEFRAYQEGGANVVEGEIRFAMYGKTPSPPDLKAYYVGPKAQKLSDQRYSKHIEEVKKLGRGGATMEASRLTLQCMRDVGILKEF